MYKIYSVVTKQSPEEIVKNSDIGWERRGV